MITSTANPQIKNLIQLQKKGKIRAEQDVFVVEGIKMYREVPKELVEKVYLSESFANGELGQEMLQERNDAVILGDQVFKSVSDTMTPQGVLAVVKRQHYALEQVTKGAAPLILVLESIQDPGNLGTILRTAEGAGVTGIIMSSDTVDIYNPKTIRSTMGSIYRVPFLYVSDLEAAVTRLREAQVKIYAAHLKGTKNYDEQDYKSSSAFLIGNEGKGLSEELAAMADEYIRIPMCGQVESLNAAVASAILMYEVFRQRR